MDISDPQEQGHSPVGVPFMAQVEHRLFFPVLRKRPKVGVIAAAAQGVPSLFPVLRIGNDILIGDVQRGRIGVRLREQIEVVLSPAHGLSRIQKASVQHLAGSAAPVKGEHALHPLSYHLVQDPDNARMACALGPCPEPFDIRMLPGYADIRRSCGAELIALPLSAQMTRADILGDRIRAPRRCAPGLNIQRTAIVLF